MHSDLNNFYASVECARNPQLRDKAVIVVGDIEARHGIVLAKNQIAKSYGIKTGDVVWEARQKCRSVIEVGADFKLYLEYSRKVKAIYAKYTDRIESFGIDECWLDVTESKKIFGNGYEIAEKIRNEVKNTLGITVSIGVSFNKIFAKLASELKKPDAVTVIDENNYKDIVWSLPVEDLLYVGKATKKKLNNWGIRTIGDLADTDIKFLNSRLGKWGVYLSVYSRGMDDSEVQKSDEVDVVKSIGNSLTCYRDLLDYDDADNLIFLLTESVTARLRESGYGKAKSCYVGYRDNLLMNYGKNVRLRFPTAHTVDIAEACCQTFRKIWDMKNPVRSISVSVSDFTGGIEQLTMAVSAEEYDRQERLEKALEQIRGKYGYGSVKRAVVAKDKRLGELNIKEDHVIHPVAFRIRKIKK